MAENTWNAVDLYFSEKLIPADEALDRALQASEAAGLPAINVAPNQGKFLMVLARITRAKRILEVEPVILLTFHVVLPQTLQGKGGATPQVGLSGLGR